MENGQLYTWGNRDWLAPHSLSLPKEYENGIKDNLIKLVAGGKFSMALCENGHVYAWGKKSSGCIPEDTLYPSNLDPQLFDFRKVVDLAASDSRCLAITDDS